MIANANDVDPGSVEFVRVDADHWLIHDNSYRASDARHVIGCVSEMDDGLDVVWVAPGIPLPTRYRDAGGVLDDLLRWRRSAAGHTRPVEIPSLPPRRQSVSR